MQNIDLTPLQELGNGGIENSQFEDGKHEIIKCSGCRKELCDIWVVQPTFNMTAKLKAKCGYCNDSSFEKEIKGKFQTGITKDSNLVDVKSEFVDGPTESGLYQKMLVITKRAK